MAPGPVQGEPTEPDGIVFPSIWACCLQCLITHEVVAETVKYIALIYKWFATWKLQTSEGRVAWQPCQSCVAAVDSILSLRTF